MNLAAANRHLSKVEDEKLAKLARELTHCLAALRGAMLARIDWQSEGETYRQLVTHIHNHEWTDETTALANRLGKHDDVKNALQNYRSVCGQIDKMSEPQILRVVALCREIKAKTRGEGGNR